MDRATDLPAIFDTLKTILVRHSEGLVAHDTIPGSKARIPKQGYHLYGTRAVSIAGLPARPTYICGIILQKRFVSFYSMPVYSHPEKFQLSPDLGKMKKGKSCINVTHLNPSLEKEIESIVVEGIALYRKEGWV